MKVKLMQIRVELYTKDMKGKYKEKPLILSNYDSEFADNQDIISTNINRGIFQVSTMDLQIDNISQDKQLKDVLTNFLNKSEAEELSPYDNFNQVLLYINNDIAFVGVTKDYAYNESSKTLNIKSQDMSYKLYRRIDCCPHILFKNTDAHTVIKDLCVHAGFERKAININPDIINYPIKQMKVEYTSTYMDILDKILKTIYGRLMFYKDGTIAVVRCYPEYKDKAPYTRETVRYDDLIMDGSYTRTETDIINKVVIKSSDKSAQAFISPYLLKHCNGEIFLDSVDEQLADTADKKQNVALRYFRDKLRHSKKFSIALVNGDLQRSIGDVLRVELNENGAKGWAMVNSIKTSIQDGEWKDSLELELLVADTWIRPVAVGGSYIKVDSMQAVKSQAKPKKKKVRRRRR
ncbi:hypothetical protein [Clostridium botulinum]|nr:hypothetical protein [Clostridium botulinum]